MKLETSASLDLADAAEAVFTVLRPIFSKLRTTHERFLDDMQKEWADKCKCAYRDRPFGADPQDNEAAERMALLGRARSRVASNYRRDLKIPKTQYDATMSDLATLETLRRKREELRAYDRLPVIQRVRSDVSLLSRNYQDALSYAEDAERLNEKYDFKLKLRDAIDYGILQVRPLYLLGKCSAAVVKADKMVELAEALPENYEAEAIKAAEMPKLWQRIAVAALFHACDARINHKDWDRSIALRDEFKYFWGKAHSVFGAPRDWLPPLKLSALSDPKWLSRASDYVDDIIKSLWIEAGTNRWVQFQRQLRCLYYGLEISRPKSLSPVSVVGATLIAMAAVAPALADDPKFTVNQVVTAIIEDSTIKTKSKCTGKEWQVFGSGLKALTVSIQGQSFALTVDRVTGRGVHGSLGSLGQLDNFAGLQPIDLVGNSSEKVLSFEKSELFLNNSTEKVFNPKLLNDVFPKLPAKATRRLPDQNNSSEKV